MKKRIWKSSSCLAKCPMELTVRKNGEGAKFIGFGNGESGDFQENIYSRALRIEARLGGGEG